MVSFLSWHEIHTYPVSIKLIDTQENTAFMGIPFEEDPAQLDLNVVEREHLSQGFTAMGHGHRVIGDKAPKKMWWKGGRQTLPDVIGWRFFAIAPRVRDLIENMEPKRHQFFPIDIYRSKDGDPVATYYWLNVCARIDCVDEEQSVFDQGVDYTGKPFRKWIRSDRMAVFDPQKAGDHHLWINPGTYLSGPVCSNAFASAAQAQNISGLTLTPQKLVQE